MKIYGNQNNIDQITGHGGWMGNGDKWVWISEYEYEYLWSLPYSLYNID